MAKFSGEHPGLAQGYYVGLFFRTIWFFFIYLVINSISNYLFGLNIFTIYVVPIILSFLLNTSLPMGEGYPFIRHGFLYFGLYAATFYVYGHIITHINSFFTPNLFWSISLVISAIFGTIGFFGYLGRGTYSKKIETVGNMGNFILLVVIFIAFWWKGAIVYLVSRVVLMFMERSLALSFLSGLSDDSEGQERIDVTP